MIFILYLELHLSNNLINDLSLELEFDIINYYKIDQ